MQVVSASQPYGSFMAQKNDLSRGKRFRALRLAAGFSQGELAKQLGIHRSNIGFWENTGVIPRSDLLKQIAELLGVSVEELLGQDSAPRRSAAPAGKTRQAFDAVAKLPRRQQEQIIKVINALVAQSTSETKADS